MGQKHAYQDTLIAEPVAPGRQLMVLIRAALNGDTATFKRAAVDLADNYTGADAKQIQKEIYRLLRNSTAEIKPLHSVGRLPVDAKSRAPLLQSACELSDPLLLDDNVEDELTTIVDEFSYSQKLAAAGLATNNTLLLCGPPGTGKTHMAGHVAARLGRPLHVVRLDSLISSLLGDTAKNIRAIFDYANGSDAILFLDELDAVAKYRDDHKELGELKRVVNTLLQGLDNLSTSTIVIGATNHPDILDPAIWRRFTHHLEIALPNQQLRKALWSHYLFGDQPKAARSSNALARISDGLSCSDIRELSLAARRRALIKNMEVCLGSIAKAITESETGKIVRPAAKKLSPSENENMIFTLDSIDNVNQSDISCLLGVSRQHVSKTLKQGENN